MSGKPKYPHNSDLTSGTWWSPDSWSLGAEEMAAHFAIPAVMDALDRALEFGSPTPPPEFAEDIKRPLKDDQRDEIKELVRLATAELLKTDRWKKKGFTGDYGDAASSFLGLEPTTLVIIVLSAAAIGAIAWYFWPQKVLECATCLAKQLDTCACADNV